MKKFHRYFLYLVLVLSATMSIAFANEDSEQAQSAFDRGQFTEAITQWEKLLPTLPPNQQIEVYLQLASAYQSLGFINQAQEYLKQAWFLTRQLQDKIRESLVLGGLSDLYLLQRDWDKAKEYAKQIVDLARQSQSPLAVATALNYQGNVLSVQENYYSDALKTYQASLEQLQLEDDAVLRAKVLGNMVQVEFVTDSSNPSHFEEALSHLRSLPVSHDQVFGLIKLGHLILTQNTRLAKEILQEALTLAKQLPDKMGIIYATGYLGEVSEKETQYVEAETFTKQAISLTQQSYVVSEFCKTAVSSAPELMYLWQWQLGRLKKIQNKLEGALVAYQLAANNLQCIQPMMIRGNYRYPPQSFYENAGKIYFELADLQLQLAHSITEESARQLKLREARDTLERLKVTELQNYFRDDCVTVTEEKYKEIDEVIKDKDNAHTAILYPMIFPNRVELLLSLPDKSLQQISVNTEDAKENPLRSIIEELLGQLEKPNNETRWLRRKAIRLYEVFIRPIERELEKIDTLVVVPDKLLRTIPFAAFYDAKDGKGKFLVEKKYALAIVPGLTLMESKSLKRDSLNFLSAGLSISEKGFEPLGQASTAIVRGIQQEQKFCQNLSTFVSLTDDQFNRYELEQTLNRTAYTMVSFDTHASFNKFSQESFLLLHGDKLTMNDLAKLFYPNLFRKEPIELLTLSACETAKGDEQAALGLAGITVKVGVRSAVGSLWKVDNEKTAQLMTGFFKNLCDNPTLSKAKALQEAQQELLKEKPHPYYWAAFLLIGNWH